MFFFIHKCQRRWQFCPVRLSFFFACLFWAAGCQIDFGQEGYLNLQPPLNALFYSCQCSFYSCPDQRIFIARIFLFLHHKASMGRRLQGKNLKFKILYLGGLLRFLFPKIFFFKLGQKFLMLIFTLELISILLEGYEIFFTLSVFLGF